MIWPATVAQCSLGFVGGFYAKKVPFFKLITTYSFDVRSNATPNSGNT